MSTVYTVLLGSGTTAAGVPLSIMVSAAGYTEILRDLLVVNNTESSGTMNIYRVTGSGARGLVFTEVPARSTYHLEMRQVIPPNSELFVVTTWANGDVSLTGYRLAQP